MAYAGFDTVDDFVKEYLFILHCRKGVTARRLRRYILANNRLNMNTLWPEMRDYLKTAIRDGIVTRKREEGGPARYKLCLSVRLSMMSEESKAMRERKIQRRKLKKQLEKGDTEHYKAEVGEEEEESEEGEEEEEELEGEEDEDESMGKEEKELSKSSQPATPNLKPTALKSVRGKQISEKRIKPKSRKEEEEEAEYVPDEGEYEEDEEHKSRSETNRGKGRKRKIERRKAMREAKKEEERQKEEQKKKEHLKVEQKKGEQQKKKPGNTHKTSVSSTSERPKFALKTGFSPKKLEKPKETKGDKFEENVEKKKVIKQTRSVSTKSQIADPLKRKRKSN